MDTDKIIKDQYNSLSLNTRRAIEAVPWKNRVGDIAGRENLNPDQTLSLEIEVMLVLYSLSPAEEFVQNFTSEAGVDEESAERIFNLVFNEIILDIQNKFENFEKSGSITPAPTQPASAVSHSNLPIVEKGETAHDTTPEEKAFMSAPAPQPAPAPSQPTPQPVTPRSIVEEKLSLVTTAAPQQPKSSYSSGQDPYREPIG